MSDINHFRAEVERLRAEVEKLRAALKEIAKVTRGWGTRRMERRRRKEVFRVSVF